MSKIKISGAKREREASLDSLNGIDKVLQAQAKGGNSVLEAGQRQQMFQRSIALHGNPSKAIGIITQIMLLEKLQAGLEWLEAPASLHQQDV